MSTQTSQVEIKGPAQAGADDILTPEAVAFVSRIVEEFAPPERPTVFTTNEQERVSDRDFMRSAGGVWCFYEEDTTTVNKIGHAMHDLMAALEAAGVPCGPVNTIDQVFAEPQAVHRGLEVEQARADLSDPVRTVASPIRMSRTPVVYDRPPPALGADTEEVLGPLPRAG